jgi:hypothetical protein
MQRLPVEQVAPPPPAQQAWPVPPQGPQVPAANVAVARPEQASVATLHEPVLPVPQHACPSAPQAPHLLPVALSMQLMPVWHWLVPPSPPPPAQQAWPAPPQGPQVPAANVAVALPEQASVATLHVPVLPVPQQACPSAPQAPHLLPVALSMQLMPVWHWLVPPPPAQQA